MGYKNSFAAFRRKSFNENVKKEDVEGSAPKGYGKNLGFWTTAYLGFQTLGSIYGEIYNRAF